jgi:biotin carboxylase
LEKEIPSCFRNARALAQTDELLVEKFLRGPQLSTESLIVDKEVFTPGYADRNYDDLGRFLPQIMENGGWVPSRFSARKNQVDDIISQCADALSIDNGVIKGDLIFTEDGQVAVVEVAARLSGGDFCESLVPLGTGVDYVTQVIRQSMGLPVETKKLQATKSVTVANRYFFLDPGVLMGIDGFDEIKRQSWIEKLEIWHQVGDTLPNIKGHGDRGGVFVVTGENRRIVQERIDAVYKKINFHIDTKQETGRGLPRSDRLV